MRELCAHTESLLLKDADCRDLCLLGLFVQCEFLPCSGVFELFSQVLEAIGQRLLWMYFKYTTAMLVYEFYARLKKNCV